MNLRIHTATLISFAWVFTGCHSNSKPRNIRDLGAVNITKKETEYSINATLPDRSKGTPWGLRFLCSKRGDDKIRVFLSNNGEDTLGFLKKLGGEELKLKSGEKALIFEGTFDELSLVGRREEAELSFRSSPSKDLTFSLSFVADRDDAGEVSTYSHYLQTGYSVR
jgi:hypothetical protein